MEIGIGICLALAALMTLVSIARMPPPHVRSGADEDFKDIHGRYPTEDDYEDPIA